MDSNSLVYSIIDNKEMCDNVYQNMIKYMKFNNSSSLLDSPFFNITGNETIETLSHENKDNKLEEIEIDFLNGKYNLSSRSDKYRFPLVFKIIYLILNNSDTEITIHNRHEESNFTLFSLSEITNQYNKYKNIVPVGLMYHGMGYYISLFMDKKTGSFFYALDGGSNGYDRKYNYDFYNNLNPETNSNLELKRFPQILNYLKTFTNVTELRYFRPNM